MRAGRARGAAALTALMLAGCEVRLGAPEYLWCLWAVPALAVFLTYAERRRRHYLARFAQAAMADRLGASGGRGRLRLRAALLLGGVAAAIVALAEPRWGYHWEEVQRRGVDIVVALDVSESMLVEDAEAGGKLTRLARAKREITDLLRVMEGDRIGLVAFAGVAFVECPLTLDYSAAELFLGDIDTDLIPVKGTALGDAIRTSLAALEGAEHKSQAIVLITDGEDHVGDALAAAEAARASGVRIYTVGIGRDEGAPIPAAGGGFHRDAQGRMVMSKLDADVLQKIASLTGGRYTRSQVGDMDLENIYRQGIKASLAAQDLGSRRQQRWEERFAWLLGIAALLLAIEALVPERPARRTTPTQRAAGAALLVALAAADARAAVPLAAAPSVAVAAGHTAVAAPLATATVLAAPGAARPAAGPAAAGQAGSAPAPAPAGAGRGMPHFADPFAAYDARAYDQALAGFVEMQVEHPGDPRLMLGVGSTHYQMGHYGEAEKAFAQATMAGDAKLRAQALYNLGNCAFRQGRLDEAIGRYTEALASDPNDADAKFNLEYARDEIRRRHEAAQKKRAEDEKRRAESPPAEPNQSSPDGAPDQAPKDESTGEEKGDGQQSPADGQGHDGDKQGGDGSKEKGQQGGGGEGGQQSPGAGHDGNQPAGAGHDGDQPANTGHDANQPAGRGQAGAGGHDAQPGPQGQAPAGTAGDAQPGAPPAGTPGSATATDRAPDDPDRALPGAVLTPRQAQRYLDATGERRPPRRPPEGEDRARNGKDW